MRRVTLLVIVLIIFATVQILRAFDGNVVEAISGINGTNAGMNIDVTEKKSIDVPSICQYPELPTGCESVAATMLLQYYNEDITAQEFAGDWLECSTDFYNVNGTDYGPDPHEVFAGDPFSEYSYGCFAKPIADAINSNSNLCKAEIITDKSLEELCSEYIDNNEPVPIWATMNMKESYEGNSWHLDDGSVFTWTAQEHCLVLVGYNDDCYFMNDPMTGSTIACEKEIVEARFAELGNQAIHLSSEKSGVLC